MHTAHAYHINGKPRKCQPWTWYKRFFYQHKALLHPCHPFNTSKLWKTKCCNCGPKSKVCQGVHGLPNSKCPCTQCLSKMLAPLDHCMDSPLPCSGHRKKNTRHCIATHAAQIASRIYAKQDPPAVLSQESGCHHHIKAVRWVASPSRQNAWTRPIST